METLRVTHFDMGLRDEIKIMCNSPQTMTYTNLLNIASNVDDDQASIRSL